MAISIKSADQIEKMRTAGKLASSVLEMIGDHVKTGITTEKLDQICHDFIVNDLDSFPAPLLTTMAFQSRYVHLLIMLFAMEYLVKKNSKKVTLLT